MEKSRRELEPLVFLRW